MQNIVVTSLDGFQIDQTVLFLRPLNDDSSASHLLNVCRKGKAKHFSGLKGTCHLNMGWEVSEVFARGKDNPQFVNPEMLNCCYG